MSPKMKVRKSERPIDPKKSLRQSIQGGFPLLALLAMMLMVL
jgi:uncharacterized protein with von Willebrand factor type A (vWA) domain